MSFLSMGSWVGTKEMFGALIRPGMEEGERVTSTATTRLVQTGTVYWCNGEFKPIKRGSVPEVATSSVAPIGNV
jgi:hypothetical protein